MTPDHPFHPVVAPSDVGAGYRRLSIGETVRWYTQWHAVGMRPDWRLTTHTGLVNDGRATYRVPMSLGAWLAVLGMVITRWWHDLF